MDKNCWDKFVGKEVFIVSEVAEMDSINTAMNVGLSLEEALKDVKLEEVNDDWHVMHGVLMPSRILPPEDSPTLKDFLEYKGSIFAVLVEKSNLGFEGVVTEYMDLDTLELDMIDTLQAITNVYAINLQNIDQYYILYGYKMPLSFYMNPKVLKEDIFNKGLVVAKSLV